MESKILVIEYLESIKEEVSTWSGDIVDYLNETCLELKWGKDEVGNLYGFEILRSYGGPTAYISSNGSNVARGFVTVEVIWAGSTSTATFYAPDFVEALDYLGNC